MTRTTKSADGTTIAYDRLGEGVVVILVHPAYGHRAFDPPMSQLADRLAERFSVFTYDRRGRGESGDRPGYAVDREVDDIAALIDEAGGSAWLYGMSSGAVLALEAASRGLPIAGLVLYEPPFILDGSRPPYPATYVQDLACMIGEGRRGDAVAFAMGHAGVPEPVLEEMRSQPFWGAFEAVAHTLVYDGRVMGDTQRGNPGALEPFRGVAVPALVMVATKAPAWARNAAQTLANILPSGKLELVDADFHAVDPSKVAPALDEFISRRACERAPAT